MNLKLFFVNHKDIELKMDDGDVDEHEVMQANYEALDEILHENGRVNIDSKLDIVGDGCLDIVEYDNVIVDEDSEFEEVEYDDEEVGEDGEFDEGEHDNEDGKFDGGEYDDEDVGEDGEYDDETGSGDVGVQEY